MCVYLQTETQRGYWLVSVYLYASLIARLSPRCTGPAVPRRGLEGSGWWGRCSWESGPFQRARRGGSGRTHQRAPCFLGWDRRRPAGSCTCAHHWNQQKEDWWSVFSVRQFYAYLSNIQDKYIQPLVFNLEGRNNVCEPTCHWQWRESILLSVSVRVLFAK